jgi:hypothetical protein
MLSRQSVLEREEGGDGWGGGGGVPVTHA